MNDDNPMVYLIPILFCVVIIVGGSALVLHKKAEKLAVETAQDDNLNTLEEKINTLDTGLKGLDSRINTLETSSHVTTVVREDLSQEKIDLLREDVTAQVVKLLPKTTEQLQREYKENYVCAFSAEQNCWKEN